MTSKLTPSVVPKIYQRAWNPRFTIPEVAKKFGICEGYVKQIKYGDVYSDITGHKKGVIPSCALKPEKKPIPKMSKDQKLTILKKGQETSIAIDEFYWQLFETYGQEVAEEFRKDVYNTRGRLGRKLSRNEVNGLFDECKNRNENMKTDTTKSDCLLDLTLSYGRFAGYKLSEAINEREQALGRKLNREEILEEYRAIDDELFPTLITRRGK